MTIADVDAVTEAAFLLDVHERTASVAYAHIFSGPFPRAEAEGRWREYEGRVVAARRDARIIGFGAWAGDVLDALYVLPEEAGRGTGAHLLASLPEAQQLWVLVDNMRGRFYEREGWLDSRVLRPAYPPVMEVLYRRWVPTCSAAHP